MDFCALALRVLGCRGGLSKMTPLLGEADVRAQLLALRLAVLFHHAREPIETPRIAIKVDKTIRCAIASRWLKAHPLSAHLLEKEREEWKALGYQWRSVR